MDADLVHWPEVPHVSRMVARPGLPIFDRTLRGVVVDGALGARWIQEAARAVAPLSRVVVVDAHGRGGVHPGEAGLKVLAAEAGTIVAARA